MTYAGFLFSRPEHLEFLDTLFDSGEFDMFHADDALEREFGLAPGPAGAVLSEWRRVLPARRGATLGRVAP
jgi:hypothetical protein